MLGAAFILPGSLMPDMALAACAPGTLCVTQAIDTGDVASVGSFSWAITQANAGGDRTISFDSTVFSSANTTLTLSGTNVQTPRVTTGVTIDGSSVPNLIIKGVTLANGRAQGGAGGEAGNDINGGGPAGGAGAVGTAPGQTGGAYSLKATAGFRARF